MGQGADTNISISAAGGDAAAAEIEKGSRAIDGLGKRQEQLKTKFGQRFSNVGLQLFAQDALRATGVTANLSPAVSSLTGLITQSAMAFGIASGGVLLLIGALTTLAAVITKIAQQNERNYEALVKANKEQRQQLQTTESTIKAIDDYVAVTKHVPPEILAWRDAEVALQKAQVERQIAGNKAELASLELMMAATDKRHQQMQDSIHDQEVLTERLRNSGVDPVTVAAQVQQLAKMRREFEQQGLTIQENKARVEELRASLRLLSSQGTDDIKRLTDAGKARVEAERKHSQDMAQIAYEEAKARSDAYYDSLNAMVAAQNKADKEIETDVARVSDKIGGSIGDAFAQSAIYGKRFTDQMRAAFKNMAASIISDLIRITLRWAALTAMGFPVGAAGAGFGRFLSFATGGEVMVDRPTLFLAGEGGPEIARFTPMSAMGSASAPTTQMAGGGGGGGGIQIGSVTTIINGVSDPNKIADRVGQKIIERIRGAGELSFVRS